MKQPIIGFHKDKQNHWVAELTSDITSMCAIIPSGKFESGLLPKKDETADSILPLNA